MADDRYSKEQMPNRAFVMDNTPAKAAETTAEQYLRTQRSVAGVDKEAFSPAAIKQLSDVRKAQISTVQENKMGLRNGSANVVGVGIKKAEFGGDFGGGYGGNGGGFGGGNYGANVDQVMPEIYSPLFQIANLNLPRDRMTMNAWNRNFYDTHPIVKNAITLHATYPISKINVKCKHHKVEQFFNDMAEKIDLFDVISGVALELWRQGEAFPYAELDETNGVWSSIVVQNPDYVNVKRSGVSNMPIISLRADETLKKVVSSNHPNDIKLRQQIPANIIHHIRKNQPIPLDNFNVSHLKMLSSPYDTRGTSIIVSCYKMLMWGDKLLECKLAQANSLVNPITMISVGEGDHHPNSRVLDEYREMFECYDEETEVLTEAGFKRYNEVIEYTRSGKPVPKEGVKVACFNSESEKLEYYEPNSASVYDYSGDMYHFANTKMDMKITPNHDLWVSNKTYKYGGSRKARTTDWGEWHKVKAAELSLNDYSRFRSQIEWDGEDKETVSILGKDMPIELYLEFLGYVLSEGCLYGSTYSILLCQTVNKYREEMEGCADKFAEFFGKKCRDRIRVGKEEHHDDLWTGTISHKPLYEFLKSEVSDKNGNTRAPFKKVPRSLMNLKPELLRVLLDAMVKGDGSVVPSESGITGYAYYTTSKQLADDVYEIVYKCGYVPTMFVRNDMGENKLPLYTLGWSTGNKGRFPKVYKTFRNAETKEKSNMLSIEKYEGKVWCFTVPTGLFITRRNGKITIQGNSAQNNKDFKIITHSAVKVERLGSVGAVIDTTNDFNYIREMLYAGLMVPKAIMDSEGASYANASVGLEVLRTRYITFRNMLEKWLEKKIFAPISEIQGFFEYKDGKKLLIVPQVDWNHINLYDLNDYIQALGPYVEKGTISMHTLYRSMGLNWEEEQRLIREENIRNMILTKEKTQLEAMSLVELNSIGPDEPILESVDGEVKAVPGEKGAEEGGADLSTSMPNIPAPSGSDVSSGGGEEIPGVSTPPAPEATPATPPPAQE